MSPVRIEFLSDPRDMQWHARVQQAFEAIAAETGLQGLAAILLPSAVVEAVNNIIRHAYNLESGFPIRIDACQDGPNLIVELRDRGAPMPASLPSGELPQELANCGRGWGIIRSVFSGVEYERIDHENRLRLCRPLTAPAPAERPADAPGTPKTKH